MRLIKIRRKSASDEAVELILKIEDKLSSITTEQNRDNLTNRRIEFLVPCMEQNLEHARHVEGERVNFMQLYIILVSAVLAFLPKADSGGINWIMIAVLWLIVCLGIFVIILTNRWTKVFIAHRTCAIRCYNELANFCELKNGTKAEFDMEIIDDVKKQIPDSQEAPVRVEYESTEKADKLMPVLEAFIGWCTQRVYILIVKFRIRSVMLENKC